MNKPYANLPLIVLLPVLALLSVACSTSPPTRFYVLSNLSRPSPTVAESDQEIAVGVGPMVLPEYLDRPQIITRTGQNELNLAEFDRWGEALKDNANQVLAENLAVLLPSKKVHTFPWKRSTKIDYQVSVKVTRFDHTDGGETALQVRWSILSGGGNTELLSRESRYTERPDGPGYSAIVAAMNRALAKFSRDVAYALRTQANEALPLP